MRLVVTVKLVKQGRRCIYLIKAGREPLPNLKRSFEVTPLSECPKHPFTSSLKYFRVVGDSRLDQGASDRVQA